MHTDANEIAGLLEEIFRHDMTSTPRVCQSCRGSNEIGAHRLYRGAGMVLRCPACGETAAAIVPMRVGHGVNLYGSWLFA